MKQKNQQPYFPHNCNSRNGDKMIRLRMKHGVAGYGVYYMLMERLRGSETFQSDLDFDVLAFDLDCDKELIRSVVEDFGLFEIINDGCQFHSIELTESMEAMLEAKRRRQEAARRAAEARWGKLASSESMDDYESKEPMLTSDPMPYGDLKPGPKLREEIRTLKADNEWREAICREFQISESKLTDYINHFENNCVCNGQKNGHLDKDGNINMIDAAKHCRSYIRKTIVGNSAKAPSVSKNQSSPITERLSQSETERIKEFNERCEARARERKNQDQNSQSGDNIYRNFGYQPKSCSMRELFDPEWRAMNPPSHPEWIGRFTGRETVEEVERQLNLEIVSA